MRSRAFPVSCPASARRIVASCPIGKGTHRALPALISINQFQSMRIGGEREGCQNSPHYMARFSQGSNLHLLNCGACHAISLIFGEQSHASGRRMAGFRHKPHDALWHSNCSFFIHNKPGRIASTVDAIPGFQFLLPQGSHFRRPLTGHSASGRSLPRVRPDVTLSTVPCTLWRHKAPPE